MGSLLLNRGQNVVRRLYSYQPYASANKIYVCPSAEARLFSRMARSMQDGTLKKPPIFAVIVANWQHFRFDTYSEMPVRRPESKQVVRRIRS
ncbi:MAG: hypothetical protein ABI895_12380 [Deltaproteobacteria bacterium]